jgi:hypothetical protein
MLKLMRIVYYFYLNKAISNKLKQSNNLIEDTDKKYGESKNKMSDTVKRLSDVFSANSSYMCYLIIFVFVVIFFLFKITK